MFLATVSFSHVSTFKVSVNSNYTSHDKCRLMNIRTEVNPLYFYPQEIQNCSHPNIYIYLNKDQFIGNYRLSKTRGPNN